MPKPRRNDEPAVRRTLFLDPKNDLELMRRAQAEGVKPSVVVDRLIEGVPPDGVAAARPMPTHQRGHVWGAPQGKYGRPCTRCEVFDKEWDRQTPCPGEKEER